MSSTQHLNICNSAMNPNELVHASEHISLACASLENETFDDKHSKIDSDCATSKSLSVASSSSMHIQSRCLLAKNLSVKLFCFA